jgi:hypothetical protein
MKKTSCLTAIETKKIPKSTKINPEPKKQQKLTGKWRLGKAPLQTI